MRPATLTINLSHLAFNYRLLQQRSAPSEIMAVVKADAYGHGLLPVAEALHNEGCRCFAVTDAAEGLLLRQHIGADVQVILFSGVFDAEDAALCEQHQLTPVVSQPEQLKLLYAANYAGNIWLKVDTGMFRIGAQSLDDLIHAVQSPMHIAGIMSHLACADSPKNPLNQIQINAFQSIQQSTNIPAYSLLNSAGIVAFCTHIKTDFVRPGIALYGSEPIPSMPLGLKPVMQLSSTIIQIRAIKKGQSVSYGATWVAPRDMFIAVVAIGYADGLPRLLSNQGEALHHSGKLPIVGRVCMDYCLLGVTDNAVSPGDKVIFFGYGQDVPIAAELAHQCQTISYELFTGMKARVTRHYIEE